MNPHIRNATGRVNRPRMISAPPKSSRTPATPESDVSAGIPLGGGTGKPRSFCRPCSMKRKPVTMRRMLSTFGAQVVEITCVSMAVASVVEGFVKRARLVPQMDNGDATHVQRNPATTYRSSDLEPPLLVPVRDALLGILGIVHVSG